MAKTAEIIVAGPDSKGCWHWRFASGERGSGLVPPHLAARLHTSGQSVRAKIKRELARAEVLDFLDEPVPELAGVLVNGRPRVGLAATIPTLAVGDVVKVDVRFSAPATGRDAGRESKVRPCVVVRVEPEGLVVRAIHGTNTVIRKLGRGIRVRAWRQAGLDKGSYVSFDDVFVEEDEIVAIVGSMSDADMSRVLAPPPLH